MENFATKDKIMKIKQLLFLVFFTPLCNAQIVTIPDVNLKNALLNQTPTIDLNNNGTIEVTEALAVTDQLVLNNSSISNMTGLHAFVNVKKINLSGNNLVSEESTPLIFNTLSVLEELDLSDNSQVWAINCNQITTLKKLYLGRDTFSVSLNAQAQLMDLKCDSMAFQGMSSFNKALLEKLNIYIIETSNTSVILGTLNNLTELYLDSYFNGGNFLNNFTGTVPNLYKITFSNITIVSTQSFSMLANVREFIFKGSCSYDYLYSKLYTLSNLKKLTLDSDYSFSPGFPGNQLNFSTNTQLEYLYLSFSSSTGSYLPIVLTNNVNLKHLELFNYNSSTISLTNNTLLEELNIVSSMYTSPINLTTNVNLKKLTLRGIALSTIATPYTINLSQNQLLEEVTIYDQYLDNLNFGGVHTIKKLDIIESRLNAITLSSFSSLMDFNLNSIKDILEVNLNNSPNLQTVNIHLATSTSSSTFPVNFFKLKNGATESSVLINKNVTNFNICTDQDDTIANWALSGNASAHHFSTYCNFTPGGVYNTVSGTMTIDVDSNSCSIADPAAANAKVVIADQQESGYTFTDANGNYTFYTQSSTVTLTPEPNLNYFLPSPQSAIINFPNQVQDQDFCIVPNGIFNDLEVSILPITLARPGFDAKYKIVYTNNGNQIQSGTINFTFNDVVLDLESTSTPYSSASANLYTYNFTSLLPFQTREITLVFHVNSPTGNPPVNAGYILHYTAAINGNTDVTPANNTFVLDQIVVNSLDPNDKTCLQGATIPPSMVGQYVYYIIRFENTGTANAQNVVVKDVIDAAKFDINSLQPVSSSHSLYVRAVNNNVEFIFENINLPFDNANNDGYVAFKIKTKPTLTVGSTFSNKADIYFDYNLPIITNNYVTTIQALGTNEVEADNKILIYPNPVNDIIHFNAGEVINKIEIYDTAGRILSSNTVHDNNVNISGLKTGNYILKIYTETGISNAKIIKK